MKRNSHVLTLAALLLYGVLYLACATTKPAPPTTPPAQILQQKPDVKSNQ